jgi:HSP20 family protein
MLVRTRPLSVRLRPFDWTFDRTLDNLVDSSTWEDGSLKLTVDLPGIPQKAVDVSVAGRALTIGVKTDGRSWERTLSVGAGLDPERVSAQYADGRLTVLVGPVPEAQPRRIEIEDATAPAIEATAPDQPEGAEADTSSTS